MGERRIVKKRKMALHPGRHDLQMRAVGVGGHILARVEDLAQIGMGGV